MIAILILSVILGIMIYSVVSIKLKICDDSTWYRVGFAVSAWFLFLFIVIEAIVYTDHNRDREALNRYNVMINELKEEQRLSKSVLSFVISKYPGAKDIKIDAIEKKDIFFKNYPELDNQEVVKVLTDYLDIKDKKLELKKKVKEREERIIYRSNHPWVFILPN